MARAKGGSLRRRRVYLWTRIIVKEDERCLFKGSRTPMTTTPYVSAAVLIRSPVSTHEVRNARGRAASLTITPTFTRVTSAFQVYRPVPSHVLHCPFSQRRHPMPSHSGQIPLPSHFLQSAISFPSVLERLITAGVASLLAVSPYGYVCGPASGTVDEFLDDP